MTDDALRSLAAWVKPTVLQLTPEDLETYRQAVIALAKGPVGADLVGAAHGLVSDAARAAVENEISAIDVTYVGGDKDELVACLAGATVMVVLTNESNLQAAVVPGLLVQSAKFVGLNQKIPGLLARANEVVDAEARRVRQRKPFKSPASSIKPLGESATIEEVVPVLNAAVKRLEVALSAAYTRILQMDEEVDTLWWARSVKNSTANKEWSELPALERVVIACLELRGLLSFLPPTLGSISLLNDVVQPLMGSARLTEVGVSLAKTDVVDFAQRGPLFPLTTAAAISAEHGDKPKIISPLLEKSGCDPKQVISLERLAEQLLREISLADLS